MKKLIIILGLAALVAPRESWCHPIVLDNNEYHVRLANSWAKIVDETREKYNYTFEITDKNKNIQSEIKIKDYGIDDAFLTSHYLNVLVNVLPPLTNGREPVCKYNQYDLTSLKQTTSIQNSQGGYFSPGKKYGILLFTYNAYLENEYDAMGFVDLTHGPARLNWMWNPKEKINIFEDSTGKGKKGYWMQGPVGWSPDENEMAFVIRWNRYDEATVIPSHGYYLVDVKNLGGVLAPVLKTVDFEKMGYGDNLRIEKIELSKETATLFMHESKDKSKPVKLNLANE